MSISSAADECILIHSLFEASHGVTRYEASIFWERSSVWKGVVSNGSIERSFHSRWLGSHDKPGDTREWQKGVFIRQWSFQIRHEYLRDHLFSYSAVLILRQNADTADVHDSIESIRAVGNVLPCTETNRGVFFSGENDSGAIKNMSFYILNWFEKGEWNSIWNNIPDLWKVSTCCLVDTRR